MTERKFKLTIPITEYKEYSIDKYKYFPLDILVPTLVEIYRTDLCDKDIDDLVNHQKYMRLMLLQDGPDTDAYMYAYCSSMDNLKIDYVNIFKQLNCGILGKIDYVTQGVFFNIKGNLKSVIKIDDIYLPN